jgi:sec-independent protein translocase protein TatA
MFNDLFDSPWKILIIAAVVLILFGSRKMPDAARSLGRSMRILKSEVQGLHQEDEAQPQQPAFTQQQLTSSPPQTSADQIEQLQQQVRDLQQQQTAASGANSASTVEAQHTQQPS